LQGELEVTGDASVISLLQVSWKNGSHRVIREGPLSDTGATPLTTVPAKSKRVFYLAVTLPKTIDNTAQNKSFTLQASLKITDVPKVAEVATSKTSQSTKGKAKTATSAVLGQSVSHTGYPLPDLQSRLLSSTPLQAADQLVQAARKQLWWGWLIVALEVVALMPWRLHIDSMWQRFSLELASIALAGLLSGWPAALAAALWLCVDLGKLSQSWEGVSPFVKQRNIKTSTVIPSEVEESSLARQAPEPEDLSTSLR
jgi:hypothetical protein